jgi:hypothetical protein
MRKSFLPAMALAAVVACSGDAPTGPVIASTSPATASGTTGYYPGSRLTADVQAGRFTPVNCSPRITYEGSARIGPAGGVLRIGPHRLVIPAGALRRKVLISGTVPEGKPFQIDLQPHGLQFRKAAGLVLDATSCIEVPPIVYIIDQVNVSAPIEAMYSNWWKTIACPIWHFSGYMVAFADGE